MFKKNLATNLSLTAVCFIFTTVSAEYVFPRKTLCFHTLSCQFANAEKVGQSLLDKPGQKSCRRKKEEPLNSLACTCAYSLKRIHCMFKNSHSSCQPRFYVYVPFSLFPCSVSD